MDAELIDSLVKLAAEGDTPIAQRSMDDIARALGMTRMTLYRRAGSREEIMTRLRALGLDVAGEPRVRERVVEATAALIRERPLVEVTLDAIASRARCSLPAIHDQFGGRQGVFRAVFEQFSPLPSLERLVSSGDLSEGLDLREDVRRIYAAVFDQMVPGWPVMRAFITEVMRDPSSDIGALFREWYVPRALAMIQPTLRRHAEHGSFRSLPPPLIAQAFIGPMLLHIATRGLLEGTFGVDAPDRVTTIETFTDLFCRAVARDPDVERGDDERHPGASRE